MKAIIMGAGSGTRMFPLTHFINKHLLHLGGKPVIRIIAERIKYSRMFDGDITIVCNTKDLKDYQWEFRDMYVNFNDFADDFNGTATQFYHTLLKIKTGPKEPVMIHYGDTITDLDYAAFLNTLEIIPNVNALIAVTENIRHDYSKVDCGDNIPGAVSVVKSIQEKPLLSFPSWTGIAVFRAQFILDFLQQNLHPLATDFGYHILPALVKEFELHAYQYDGRWFDVGNLRSYRLLVDEFQKDTKII